MRDKIDIASKIKASVQYLHVSEEVEGVEVN